MNGAAFVHDDDMMDAIVHSLPKGTKPAGFHRRKPASPQKARSSFFLF
jgi:hypothetical protein